jgi:hypothetical protein
MRTSLCCLALVALAAVATSTGCNRDKAGPGGGSAGGEGSSAFRSSSPGGSSVELFVDDVSVGKVRPPQLASWPRLDSLVPDEARRLGTWELVTLQGKGAKPIEISHPSTAYPDLVPAIFPGEVQGSGASFGMFDPVELARHGKPALREDGVWAVRIKLAKGSDRGKNDDGGGGGGDPTKLVVTVTTPEGATQLTGEQIMALPREPMPGQADQKGWPLTALLTAAGVKSYQRLVLRDSSGANLTLEKADVSDSSVPFIKLNKQGALRFRVIKKAGDGWTPSGDLRGLVAIDAK